MGLQLSTPKSSVKGEVGEENGIDIMSNLPDHIIHHIFSFLSTEDVFRTSVLSTRWRYLWTSLANLDLKYKFPRNMKADQHAMYNRNFLEFLNRVLVFHDASDIKSFNMMLYVLPDQFSRLNSWISIAVDRNVEELELNIIHPEAKYELPCSLSTCRSLILLKISAKLTIRSPPFTCFLNLKKLYLSSVIFVDDVSTQRLFSNCPVLEELALRSCKGKNIQNITISIPTLKILTISNPVFSERGCLIKIYSSNLTELECRIDLNLNICMCDLPFLDNASLKSCYDGFISDVSDRVGSLIMGINKVKNLVIDEPILQTMVGMKKNLPHFYMLTHLEVWIDDYEALKEFLQKTPNLENLKLFSSSYFRRIPDPTQERVPSCFKSGLKTFAFQNFDARENEMALLEHVLRHATGLKSLSITCSILLQEERLAEAKDRLLNVPKGSQSCNIEFTF